MLARIKLDLPSIRKALLEVDDDKLSVEELRAISKHLPTTEEVGTHKFSQRLAGRLKLFVGHAN